jgi:hypothetical protein
MNLTRKLPCAVVAAGAAAIGVWLGSADIAHAEPPLSTSQVRLQATCDDARHFRG